MGFKEGGDLREIHQGFSARELLSIQAVPGEKLAQCGRPCNEATVEVDGLQFSEKPRGAHQPLLLAAKNEHAVVAREHDALGLQP